MKMLVVHPGATTSTHDVFVGLATALTAQGHVLYDYALDARIAKNGEYLHWLWQRKRRAAKKGGAPEPTKHSSADILYAAGEELVARALRVVPDVVLVVSGMYLHPDVLVLLRRAGVPVAVLFTESPYDDERQERLLPYVNVAWTNERSSVRSGLRYLPHAWNPQVHDLAAPLDEQVPAHDVVFVGTGFVERVDLLAAVDWRGIDLGLYGSWDLVGSRSKLRQYIKGEHVENAMAAQLYRRAAIGLNLYRQSKGFGRNAPRIGEGAASLNPRAYELAALGCFTVSDARAEVTEVFGDLVPTFAQPTEVRPLLDRWLADAAGRARVQAQLPAAVAAHTWHARAAQMVTDLRAVGIGSRAPSREPWRAAEAVAAGV